MYKKNVIKRRIKEGLAISILLFSMMSINTFAGPTDTFIVEMVKDINSGSADSNPDSWIVYEDLLYFTADDGANGQELWVSDGTSGGTHIFKDINPGAGSSHPFYYIVYDNKLYFRAFDGANGQELWVTDGTPGGTYMVKDINPNIGGDSDPLHFIVCDNFLYFTADDGTNGEELWVTDGTSGGTHLVKDINPGSDSSYAMWFIVFEDELYFRAYDGSHGYELWKSNGTEAGTIMVKDIYPGAGGSYLEDLSIFQNELYFHANDGTNGHELWKSNGTESGTIMVKDINLGSGDSSPFGFTNLDDMLFFSADDGTNGRELWVSNGTSDGTHLFKNLNLVGDSYPQELTAINNIIYFTAVDANGWELWVCDGTLSGTKMLKDINPDSANSWADGYCFILYDSHIIFWADNNINGVEPWVTDGTEAGTKLLEDINPGTGDSSDEGYMFVLFDNKIYLGADDGTNGNELWSISISEDEITVTKDFRYTNVDWNCLYMKEDWAKASVPTLPTKWHTTHPGYWATSNSNYAGGAGPEAKFSWGVDISTFRLYSDPMDTTGYTQMKLSFKQFVDHYSGPYELQVQTSTDGINWNDVWSIVNPTDDIGPEEVVIPLTSADGIGSSTFRISFTFVGDSFNINYWYIDNIKLLKPAKLGNLLPQDIDGNYLVDVVLKPKKNTVSSTNPGQIYGVISITGPVEEITMTDYFDNEFDVNPAKKGGGVEVIMVDPDGYATILTYEPGVSATVYNYANPGHVDISIDLDEPLQAGYTLMIYIKFQTSMKGSPFPNLDPYYNYWFVNEVEAYINEITEPFLTHEAIHLSVK